jgi:phosphonate metabolism protein (transferase hexapeptide repeat family)
MERCDIVSTEIGKFTNIASEVRINPGNHPMDWVSQHHFLYRCRLYGFRDKDNKAFFEWRQRQRVRIGHDCWVGHKAIILPNVTIGNGAVIAAGAIVTKNVAPYTIVAGVPAKQVGKRFPEAIWQALEEISWWDWDYETLKKRLDDFYDIRKFIHLYGDRP